MDFEIEPYTRVGPLFLKMSREKVCEILATPDFVSQSLNGCHTELWNEFGLSLAFNSDNQLVQLSLMPGSANVSVQSVQSIQLMTKGTVSDFIPSLLGIDNEPREWNGFLIFLRLGIFARPHSQERPKTQDLHVFPRGAWDEYMHETELADLSEYNRP